MKLPEMIVFVHGPPKLGDLNFIPRVFGKGIDQTKIPRMVIALTPEHVFRLRARSWFHRPR